MMKIKLKVKAMVFTNTQEYYQKESIDFGAKVKFNTTIKVMR